MNFDRIEKFNEFIRKIFRWGRKPWLEASARIRGRRFYCGALAGRSCYNICINSDMTVSCNCRDNDGSGHIGDLSVQTLEEVFAGGTADRFRRSLARGRLPIPTCSSCPELRQVPPLEAEKQITAYQMPVEGLMVENTIACNYHCASCSRAEVMRIRRKMVLSDQDVQVISRTIKQHCIKQISLFNLGEPFSSPNILRHLRIIRSDNPEVRIIISTNGALLNTDEKTEAALLADHLIFSIDGVDNPTLTRYQRGGDFARAYENMEAVVRLRDSQTGRNPLIEWKYVVFNWNDRRWMIEKAVELARQAQVDLVSFWPTRVPVYGISWRYYLKGYLKDLGDASWQGREVWMRPAQRSR